MAGPATHSILKLCVEFHQVDQFGNQTPTPKFRPYLAPEVYWNIEKPEERIQFGIGDRLCTTMRAPAPAPGTARPHIRDPTAGKLVSMSAYGA